MLKTASTNVLAAAGVGLLILLIGLVTLFASQLINRTVLEQFRSQELQLTSSLAQQTETYFNGLNADITSLSLQPNIKTALISQRGAALGLMDQHAARHPGIIRSIIRFDYRGAARYAWPLALESSLEAGERPPYGLPSRLTDQTRNGGEVPLDVEMLDASRRDAPQGTFLLVAPVYTDTRKTEFVAYELDLDELFNRLMGFVQLDASDQLWVIDSLSNVRFQANEALPITSLLDRIPLASLLSFRDATIQDYTPARGSERLAVIAPIRIQGKVFVVILSRSVTAAQRAVQSDIRLIFVLAALSMLLLSGMAWLVALRLAREARRRREEVQRRETARTLLEVARALNSTLDLQDVLHRIMAELARLVPYESAAVFLLDRSRLAVVAQRGSGLAPDAGADLSPQDAPAAHRVIQTGQPLVIPDTHADDRWQSLAADGVTCSWMGIPLRVRDRTVGVLNVSSQTAGRYGPEEIELAQAFADQASVALQNARLHEMEVKQIEQELSIARQIQTSLLPAAAPTLPELEIAAYTMPARQVSGDYFQYLPLPNGQWAIAVGDVSGKGIPAALLMAVITTALRDEIAQHARPADLLNALNRRLLERMQAAHVNSALLVSVFDPAARCLEIANGGMIQPYLRSGGTWAYVPIGGYPLGVARRLSYAARTITLAAGALLLIASDGVVEAQNAGGEFYGFERLEALLNALPAGISAQGVIDAVLAAVRQHTGDSEPQDDVTIVVLRALETAPEGVT